MPQSFEYLTDEFSENMASQPDTYHRLDPAPCREETNAPRNPPSSEYDLVSAATVDINKKIAHEEKLRILPASFPLLIKGSSYFPTVPRLLPLLAVGCG